MKGLGFRLFGIPVRVQFVFWLMAAVLHFRAPSLTTIIIWMLCVFVSVLVHELGHAFAFRAFGAEAAIELHAMGGLTRNLSQTRLRPWQSAMVSLAGPFAGFALGAAVELFFVATGSSTGPTGVLVQKYIRWTAFGWGIINLIPVLPLDGGNVVRELLSWKDPEKGAMRALVFSIVVGLCLSLGLFVFRPDYQLMSVFFLLFVYSSGRQLYDMRRLIADRKAGMFALIDRAQHELREHRFADAVQHAREVVEQARTSKLKIAAAHIGASACIESGRAEEGLQLLGRLSPHDVEPFLYGACLLSSGRISDSIPYLEEAVKAEPQSALARELLVNALEGAGMRERAQEERERR